MDDFDHIFKIVVTGDYNVGKSHIIAKYVNPDVSTKIESTIGVDFKVKSLYVDGKNVKLQIWDTAGQEKFRAIISPFYKGAYGVFIVFDVINIESFRNIDYWIEQVRLYNEAAQIIIIGNKIDVVNTYFNNYKEIMNSIERFNLQYIEVSAINNAEITTMFEVMTKKILNSIVKVPEKIENKIVEVELPEIKKSKCCKIM